MERQNLRIPDAFSDADLAIFWQGLSEDVRNIITDLGENESWVLEDTEPQFLSSVEDWTDSLSETILTQLRDHLPDLITVIGFMSLKRATFFMYFLRGQDAKLFDELVFFAAEHYEQPEYHRICTIFLDRLRVMDGTRVLQQVMDVNRLTLVMHVIDKTNKQRGVL